MTPGRRRISPIEKQQSRHRRLHAVVLATRSRVEEGMQALMNDPVFTVADYMKQAALVAGSP